MRKKISIGFIFLEHLSQLFEKNPNLLNNLSSSFSTFETLPRIMNLVNRNLIYAYSNILQPRQTEIGNPMIIWDKKPLFFMHIPKTGGSTISRWLQNYFHPLQIFPEKSLISYHSSQFANYNDILKYKFFCSHLDYKHYIDLPHKEKTIITILRDPKKRIYSLYKYYRYVGKLDATLIETAEHHAAKTHTFDEFLTLKGPIRNHFDNVYLRHFSDAWVDVNGNDPLTDQPEKYLDLALQRLETFDAVGILEEFEKTVTLFSNVLGIEIINVKPATVFSRMVTLSGTPTEIEEIKTTSLTEQLVAQCSNFDYIIYNKSRKIFNEKMNNLLQVKKNSCSEIA